MRLVAAVPEPGTALLIGLGIGALALQEGEGPMMRRRWMLLLPLLALAFARPGHVSVGWPGGTFVVEQYLLAPGYVEPHTPGSGAPQEMAPTATVQAIVGTQPDLNRVSYLRTYLARANAPAPRAILIFIPGFLGGAGTFSPLAKQLVTKYNGNLEVWVGRSATQPARGPARLRVRERTARRTRRTTDETRDALYAGTFFYLPEPEDGSIDTNENGEVDPPTELPDALGNLSSYLRLGQDDMRFAAHWGVDTNVRDWKVLVDRARAIVGPHGVVLFGGHSQGTYWASVFAAYDFDPDPNVVDAGYSHIDGIVLLEGGGGRGPSASAPDFAEYQSTVADLEQVGGPDIFLESFQGIEPSILGPGAELAGLAGIHLPDEPAIVQRTSVFQTPPFSLFFLAPSDNRSLIGVFIDDDFQPFTAFRASLGFSDDGVNFYAPSGAGLGSFYIRQANGDVRTWKDFDDPTLPTCPPGLFNKSPGCAILDNGPRPLPTDPPVNWGARSRSHQPRRHPRDPDGAVELRRVVLPLGPLEPRRQLRHRLERTRRGVRRRDRQRGSAGADPERQRERARALRRRLERSRAAREQLHDLPRLDRDTGRRPADRADRRLRAPRRAHRTRQRHGSADGRLDQPTDGEKTTRPLTRTSTRLENNSKAPSPFFPA